VLLWASLAAGAYRGWPLAVAQLITLAGVLLWILTMAVDGRLEWRRTALDLPLALLVALVLVQIALGNGFLVVWALAPPLANAEVPIDLPAPLFMLGTVSTAQTARSLLLLLTYAGMYVLVVNLIRERRELDRLVRTLLLFGGGLAFCGLIDYLAGEAWLIRWREDQSRWRLLGTFVNPDHFGAWLSMLVCLGLGYVAARRRVGKHEASLVDVLRSRRGREEMVRRYLPFIAVAVMGLTLIFTLSRGAVLSLLLTLGAFLVLMGMLGRLRWSLALVGSLLVVMLGYGAWIGLEPFVVRVFHDEYAGRWVQATTTLPMLWDFPVLGVGLGAYKDIYFRYQPPALHPGKVYYPYAHNDLLQLAVELGLVGALVVLFAVWRVAHDLAGSHVLGRGHCPVGGGDGERSRRRDLFSIGIALGALGAVLALIFHSAFDFSARIPANGILAAACLGIATVALHTRFYDEAHLLTAVRTRALGSAVRVAGVGALAIALSLAVVPFLVRPALVEAELEALQGPDLLRHLEQALTIDRQDVRALAARARIRLEAARRLPRFRQHATVLLNGAIEDLRTALSVTPTDPFLHERLAWTYGTLAAVETPPFPQRIPMAVTHLRRAIALAPANPFLYRSLAALAATQPGSLRAVGLQAARETARRDPELLADLVDRFLPLRLSEAEWLALAPDSALDRLQLGARLEARALFREAGAMYRQAVEAARPEEEPFARWVLATLMLRVGQYDAAALELEAALRRDPDNPELQLRRGDVLAARGDPAALDAYRAGVTAAEAITRKPGHDSLPFPLKALGARAFIAERLGMGELLTVARYRRALSQYLTDQKLWAQALDALTAVLAENPKDPVAHFALGVTLDSLGLTEQAMAAYRTAVSLDGRARFRLRLAQRLWDTEQYVQAMNEWHAVKAQEPGNVEARLALARAYLKTGERIEAFREYQSVLRIAPDQSEARQAVTRMGALPGSLPPGPR
jgi:tetratricopeptide (TPR) repeat protein/O-antigen ligase